MEKVSAEQIYCSLENESEVLIYDQDYWTDQRKNRGTDKSLCDSSNNIEHSVISKIDKEIKNTQQNFYRPKKIQKLQALPSSKQLQKLSNPHYILREGYLKKKTDGFFFSWHTRYMVLTPQKLYSFEDDQKSKVIGCVNLKIMQTQLRSHSEGIVLDFRGQCENMLLKAQSKQDEKQWMQQLSQVLQFHSKESKLMLKTMNRFIYEHKDVFTQKQFMQQAETGDILLFYTQNLGAKVQRVLTNSDFDHVAMVVKMKKKQPMVFESNQMHGVSIYDWKQYINYFDLYGKVTLRKLNYIRKTQAQTTLLQFVKKNLGKKYDINAYKLIKLESDFNWEDVKQERGYFCSQLVAKALKSIGLLDEKKSCGRYWPVDFSQKNNLQLKKGAALGPQQTVILNKHTKNPV